MTGTIKFEFTDDGVQVKCNVRDVSIVDKMLAVHSMKDCLEMPKEIFGLYAMMEMEGVFDHTESVRMPGNIAEMLQGMKGDTNDEG